MIKLLKLCPKEHVLNIDQNYHTFYVKTPTPTEEEAEKYGPRKPVLVLNGRPMEHVTGTRGGRGE